MIARSNNDSKVYQTLYPLVNGCARHATFRSYIFKRNTGVLRNDFQNLPVKIIYFFHDINT